ncbi:MAG TPA: hypothetical protein VGY58_23105 [Gemmataceae bacterium]|jgi:hypothetical protein|nr:hypothetical protein [Gemmataceae bacterium]
MHLSSSSMELNGGLKDLRALWETTKDVWNDPVRIVFEEQHYVPLEHSVLGAIRAIERLAPVMEKCQHECG